MNNDLLLLIFFFLQEGVSSKTPEVVDSLKGVPLPKTIPEFLGAGLILFLSPTVAGTMISAWANKTTIKDAKTEELKKKIEDKNDELNKKDIQIEILKVKLENTERRNQELQAENRELKEMTSTGFTRQEQALKEHIRNLQAEIESLKSR